MIWMAPTNLPVQLTSFVGREWELAEVRRLVSTSRLATLTGAGGCGKTRLALQGAGALSDTFADGVWLVNLVPLREPVLVAQIVAQALGLHQVPNQAPLELLMDWVQPRQLLLILDNCEHLVEACAQLAQSLLLHAPQLHILATSREPLAIMGETVYHVPPLSLPPEGSGSVELRDIRDTRDTRDVTASGGVSPHPLADRQRRLDTEELVQYDAIRLFVERARAVSSNFMLVPENAAAVVEICRRLDGIPLALELASASVRVLSVQQIAERLDDRFTLLTSAQRMPGVPHHHTLHEAIDWSYALLRPEEQTMLQRLAVFAAGCTLDTAEAVCAGEQLEEGQVLGLLSALVDKSLVAAETLSQPQARYRLLESIREYALEKQNELGEAPRLRDRHLDLFVLRAEETAPKLQGPFQHLWLNWLEGELDNIRAALAWSLESRRVEAGLRLAVALNPFWMTRGSLYEGRTWLERLRAQTNDQVPLLLRASGATYTSFLAGLLGDSAAAMIHAHEAVALCEAAGDEGKPLLAMALGSQAGAARAYGDHVTAFSLCERAIRLFRELDDRFGLGMSLFVQAMEATALGKYDTARALLDESLSLAREMGDTYRIAMSLNYLGDLERCEQHFPRAQRAYERSLSYLRELGASRDIAGVMHNLAHTHLHKRDVERARALFSESMVSQRAQGNRQGVAECLIGFGAMAVVRGLPAEAARLLAVGIALGGPGLLFQWPAERMEYERYLASAQAQLADGEFQELEAEGRALTMEQAIEYALSLPLADEAKEVEGQWGLTPREREVVALIARAKSNAEIAQELVLSKRTVEKHVGNILSRLGFSSREQIVRWAIENRLTQVSL
jgi:predicted ATPase/DNA-binding CsgD family transcriptional regulator